MVFPCYNKLCQHSKIKKEFAHRIFYKNKMIQTLVKVSKFDIDLTIDYMLKISLAAIIY